jgi:hypothetical protein
MDLSGCVAIVQLDRQSVLFSLWWQRDCNFWFGLAAAANTMAQRMANFRFLQKFQISAWVR